MTADDLCEIIVTAPEPAWLRDLCHALIDQHLAASTHIIHPVTSVYRWKGTVRETTEARAFLRSRREHLDAIVTYVIERHPYETPNITALPLIGGNPDYLAWIRAETTGVSFRR